MEERINIHAVWRLRSESLDEAAERLNQTLQSLGTVSSEWNNWWRSYKDFAERHRGPVYLGNRLDLIHQGMLEGRIKDPSGRPDDEMGYRIRVSAGQEKGKGTHNSHLLLNCCIRTPYLPYNTLSLELPAKSASTRLYDAELLSRAIGAIVSIWNPDWVIARDLLVAVVRPPWEGGPVLGWVNYLSSTTGVVEGDLPPQWHWFEGRGDRQIFIYEGGVPEPSNSCHVSAFEQLASRICWRKPS